MNTTKKRSKTVRKTPVTNRQILDLMRKDMGSMKKNIGSLRKDMGSMKQDMGSMKQDMSSMKQDIGSLKKDVSSLKKNVSSLDGRVTNVEGTTERLVLAVVDIQDTLRTIQNEMATKTDMHEMQKTLDRYATEIQAVKQEQVMAVAYHDRTDSVIACHEKDIQKIKLHVGLGQQ
ncbi:MAG: hypothetical protein HYV32_00295 [Candidatus Kerfeldbacteria bacterium]|nr:hypothetical protein [Candidatus Kerfeldbacteria bacterium]